MARSTIRPGRGGRRSRATQAGIAAGVVLSLAGCTAPVDSTADTPPEQERASTVTDPDAGTGHASSAIPDEPTTTLTPEPTSAGPLSPQDMPAPALLGEAWGYTVIDGDPHDTGFVGNNAATHQRNPIEVAELAVPFGCADRRTAAIVPEYALDATYARGDHQAIAIRMRFNSPAEAEEFLATRLAALRACAAQDPAYDGRQTVPYVRQIREVTLSRRTEPAVPGHWDEVATPHGTTDVLLVAVQDPSRRDTQALASRITALNRQAEPVSRG